MVCSGIGRQVGEVIGKAALPIGGTISASVHAVNKALTLVPLIPDEPTGRAGMHRYRIP
jgi:hypothetical protein